jgi:hypothetical protein
MSNYAGESAGGLTSGVEGQGRDGLDAQSVKDCKIVGNLLDDCRSIAAFDYHLQSCKEPINGLSVRLKHG